MRSLFRDRLPDATVRTINRLRDAVQIDPQYQREGDIWDRRRKQFLIDSLINGFDVPKLYLRHFVPATEIGGRTFDFAVIDGRQRLEAIWGFLSDEFGLSREFNYVDEPSLSEHLINLRYSELSLRYPRIASDLMQYQLDIVTVETDDEDLIDDMFLRLNDGVPLNAAEKRNAYGGPVPPLSRELADHEFFRKCMKLPDRRYRYYEIATKFLYFEERRGVTDTKKVYLDRFVHNAGPGSQDRIRALGEAVKQRLDLLSRVFGNNDFLLDTAGMVSVYYLLAMSAIDDGWAGNLSRRELVQFNLYRSNNKLKAGQDEADADYDLLEFERFAQSPNDSIALRFRRDVILRFLGHHSDEPLID